MRQARSFRVLRRLCKTFKGYIPELQYPCHRSRAMVSRPKQHRQVRRRKCYHRRTARAAPVRRQGQRRRHCRILRRPHRIRLLLPEITGTKGKLTVNMNAASKLIGVYGS